MVWQHTVVHSDLHGLADALNGMSASGWELVAVTRTFDSFSLFFKRPARA